MLKGINQCVHALEMSNTSLHYFYPNLSLLYWRLYSPKDFTLEAHVRNLFEIRMFKQFASVSITNPADHEEKEGKKN